MNMNTNIPVQRIKGNYENENKNLILFAEVCANEKLMKLISSILKTTAETNSFFLRFTRPREREKKLDLFRHTNETNANIFYTKVNILLLHLIP